MAFSVLVSARTQQEIENAIDYYAKYSEDAPANFITSLKYAYQQLSINPFQRLRYKSIRAIKLNKFPFSLYFTLNKKTKTVKVLSCFHNKRNPDKRP